MSPSNRQDVDYPENWNFVSDTGNNWANTGQVVSNEEIHQQAIDGNDSYGIFNTGTTDVIRTSEGLSSVMHGRPFSLFTNGVASLGWMDTLTRFNGGDASIVNGTSFAPNKIAMLPKLFMGILMLPAAERAYNFLRISIRHKFAFKGIRGISAGAGDPVFNPVSDSWGYRNEYTAGSIPDSSKRRQEKGIVKSA